MAQQKPTNAHDHQRQNSSHLVFYHKFYKQNIKDILKDTQVKPTQFLYTYHLRRVPLKACSFLPYSVFTVHFFYCYLPYLFKGQKTTVRIMIMRQPTRPPTRQNLLNRIFLECPLDEVVGLR